MTRVMSVNIKKSSFFSACLCFINVHFYMFMKKSFDPSFKMNHSEGFRDVKWTHEVNGGGMEGQTDRRKKLQHNKPYRTNSMYWDR